MDVLARLATEEPDLSGLPGELSEVITACLHRVPRQRPTSSAMLVQLGDFTVAQAGPDEEHSYLPDKAMALIGEYQRSPQIGPLGQFAGERADDATSASYTELPASYKPAPRRKPGHGRTGPGTGARPGSAGGRQGPGWRRWLRAHMAWAGWASVGAALVVVGVILGAALSSSSSASTASGPGGPGGPPPAPPKSVCGSSGHAGGGPDACMVRESQGTTGAAWLVQASGFEPGQPVTVTLNLNSPPQDRASPDVHPHRPHDAVRRDLPAEHQSALPRRAPARAVQRPGHRTGRPRGHHDVHGDPAGLNPGSTRGLPGGNARPGRPAGSGRPR